MFILFWIETDTFRSNTELQHVANQRYYATYPDIYRMNLICKAYFYNITGSLCLPSASDSDHLQLQWWWKGNFMTNVGFSLVNWYTLSCVWPIFSPPKHLNWEIAISSWARFLCSVAVSQKVPITSEKAHLCKIIWLEV